jgi:hypothetical protein
MPDNSWRQRHVGLAVAYNSWQYFQATADTFWFAEHGAPEQSISCFAPSPASESTRTS